VREIPGSSPGTPTNGFSLRPASPVRRADQPPEADRRSKSFSKFNVRIFAKKSSDFVQNGEPNKISPSTWGIFYFGVF
ncbi:hypothetical protein KKD19_04630, partial [Patescibacteria group bacterium]|nr:hypothetical protein [Patescibacteria group bacterium]